MHSVPIIDDPARQGVPRRTFSRQRIDTLVYADFGPGNGGFPINVSEGGMAFQGIQPLEQGQVICIKLKLPVTNEIVETSGQVVWLNELGKGGGLRFIDVTKESHQLIQKWLTLQEKVENKKDSVPVDTGREEQKPYRSSAPIPLEVREGNATSKTTATLPRSIFSSLAAVEVNASNKAAAGSPQFATVRRATHQAAETRRTWVLPFTIGMIASAAIMVAILSFYGVISIQFRWPQNVTSQAVAPPANGSEVAKISGSPTVVSSATGREADRSAPVTSVSSVSPAITKKVSTPAPDPPAARVSQPNPSKPATPTTTSSPKSPLEKLMTAKPIAPSPVKPAAPSEVLPPSFELPGKSDSGAQLSMISPKSPAPAPPAAATTRVSGNFEEAQLITRSAPVFPMVAKQAGVSGSVQLQFTITTEGKVRDVSVIKGNPMLSRAAIDAVQTWRYHPARLGGIPIEAQSTTIINFKSN